MNEIEKALEILANRKIKSKYLGHSNYVEIMAVTPQEQESAKQALKFLRRIKGNNRRQIKDAFESGYIQGHNDSVESCYGDPEEMAEAYLTTAEEVEDETTS